MLTLKGKKIAVLGLMQEGCEMIKALSKLGAHVSGFGTGDSRQISEVEKNLKNVNCPLVWSAEQADFSDFDLMVTAVGGGLYEKQKKNAESRGIQSLSTLDLACQFMKAPIIAVTGTNGKSSTVAILAHLLQRQGYKLSVLGGDFGYWAEALQNKTQPHYYLLELSSARLETVQKLHPHLAIFLNLFPAHGNRHSGGIAGYYDAKSRIFINQTEKDYLIYGTTGKNLCELIEKKSPRSIRVAFSLGKAPTPTGISLEDQTLTWISPEGQKEIYSLTKAKNKFSTYLLNLMAAIAAARICKVDPKHIQWTIEHLDFFDHRMAVIRNKGGVLFIDDSRSTNIGSAVWALNSIPRPVLWIAGGAIIQGSDLENLPQYIRGKIKTIFLIGADQEKLAKLWGGIAPMVEVKDLGEAIEQANKRAEPQDVVLFSPGCPPDLYTQGMEMDGDFFKKKVMKLPEPPRVTPKKPSMTRI